jgi:hypothetical protein
VQAAHSYLPGRAKLLHLWYLARRRAACQGCIAGSVSGGLNPLGSVEAIGPQNRSMAKAMAISPSAR